jgi:peptide-methionine (S)-S-oxide reductase
VNKAAFAAGCFWGVEYKFSRLKGVINTQVGYMGGAMNNPTYPDVCSGETGHVETVLIEYDENLISYEELLEFFWSIHNPTQKNGQGFDIGSQYRSVIFYYTKEQKENAEKSKKQLENNKKFQTPIVTEIVQASTFWRAEEYHQKYYERKHLY